MIRSSDLYPQYRLAPVFNPCARLVLQLNVAGELLCTPSGSAFDTRTPLRWCWGKKKDSGLPILSESELVNVSHCSSLTLGRGGGVRNVCDL